MTCCENEVSVVRMSPSQRVVAAAENVRQIVEADRRRLAAKLQRLDERVAAGDVHLTRHRAAVARHLAVRGGHR